MKTDIEKRWRRHGRLISLLGVTSERLGDSRLALTHTDPSLLVFDPRDPCPWLSDIGQVEYLVENHNQIVNHGNKGVISRLLLVPNRPPVSGPLLYTYLAAVKAVIHLQLYEGVRVWLAFVPPDSGLDLRFSHSMERVSKSIRVWPSSDYYVQIDAHEAVEAPVTMAERIGRDVDEAIAGALRVAPYRDEHFLPANRISFAASWRRILWMLNARKCSWCQEPLGHKGFQVDHSRPLHPEEDQCRPTPSGNSNIFNLAALCGPCNRKKSNKADWLPESLIPTLIPDPRVAEYFRYSLSVPPSLGEHRLPKTPASPAQFP